MADDLDNGWVERVTVPTVPRRDCQRRRNSGSRYSDNQKLNSISDEMKTVMDVPSKKVGKIIGKQGSKIKEIQSSSGATVYVGNDDSDGQTKVTIVGDKVARHKCKVMIEMITGQFSIFSLASEPVVEEPSPPVIDWDRLNKLSLEYEKKKWAQCPPIKRNFYVEHPEVSAMSKDYVKRLRRSLNNITVKSAFGGDDAHIPNPIEKFEHAFGEYPEIMQLIKRQSFENPSPIQAQAWPILLSGRDMIGIAQTGTGKTLAFLLPALIHTDGQEVPRSERAGPSVLILAPTRELVLQIGQEVQKYSYRGIKSICIYGGGNRKDQIEEVTKGVEIVIATPGRLNDLILAGAVTVRWVTYFILDEADRMFDLGFEPQIRKILVDMRPDKQTVMTSATWPFSIQNLAQRHMKEPIQVVVGSLDLAAVHTVKQRVIIMDQREKMDYLMKYVENLSDEDKLIIFADKKIEVDCISSDFALSGIMCQSIHGSRDQEDREQAIEEMKTGEVRILVATDVASRGIDIADVTKVVNYDFPRNVEEYVHRVGRTGRAGKTGEAVTFFTKYDCAHAKTLICILEEASQEVPDELFTMRDEFENKKVSRRNRNYGHRGYRW